MNLHQHHHILEGNILNVCGHSPVIPVKWYFCQLCVQLRPLGILQDLCARNLCARGVLCKCAGMMHQVLLACSVVMTPVHILSQ